MHQFCRYCNEIITKATGRVYARRLYKPQEVRYYCAFCFDIIIRPRYIRRYGRDFYQVA